MLLDVTVQKVALGPLHLDDREPVGANLNALLEKLKIDIIGQAHLAKMFGDRLIPFGMVADRAQEAANCPGLLEYQKPARFVDRKSTRLNSSHSQISYAVFCLKKKNTSTVCRITVLARNIA